MHGLLQSKVRLVFLAVNFNMPMFEFTFPFFLELPFSCEPMDLMEIDFGGVNQVIYSFFAYDWVRSN